VCVNRHCEIRSTHSKPGVSPHVLEFVCKDLGVEAKAKAEDLKMDGLWTPEYGGQSLYLTTLQSLNCLAVIWFILVNYAGDPGCMIYTYNPRSVGDCVQLLHNIIISKMLNMFQCAI
jgi:hypothetical protein